MTYSYQVSVFNNVEYTPLEEQQGLQRPYTVLTEYTLFELFNDGFKLSALFHGTTGVIVNILSSVRHAFSVISSLHIFLLYTTVINLRKMHKNLMRKVCFFMATMNRVHLGVNS